MSLRASMRIDRRSAVPCSTLYTTSGTLFRLFSFPSTSVTLRPSWYASLVVVCLQHGRAASRPTVIRLTSYHRYIHRPLGQALRMHEMYTWEPELVSGRVSEPRDPEESRASSRRWERTKVSPIATAAPLLLQIAKGSWFIARVIRPPRGPPCRDWSSISPLPYF